MNTTTIRKFIPLLALVLGIALLAFIGYSIYNAATFRVTGIDPPARAVSQYSPYIRISFNKKLDPNSLKVSDFGGILRSSAAKDKSILLYFEDTLKVGQRYSLTVDSVSSTDGRKMPKIVYSFTAKNIPINKLSKDQQDGILREQNNYMPYSTQTTNYIGFSVLTDRGMSADQVNSIKETIYEYSESISKEFKNIELGSASLNIVFRDPSSRESGASSATFTITTLGTTYVVRAEYKNLRDTVYTRILDTNNTQLYSSDQS